MVYHLSRLENAKIDKKQPDVNANFPYEIVLKSRRLCPLVCWYRKFSRVWAIPRRFQHMPEKEINAQREVLLLGRASTLQTWAWSYFQSMCSQSRINTSSPSVTTHHMEDTLEASEQQPRSCKVDISGRRCLKMLDKWASKNFQLRIKDYFRKRSQYFSKRLGA